jgi:hypothetical protein
MPTQPTLDRRHSEPHSPPAAYGRPAGLHEAAGACQRAVNREKPRTSWRPYVRHGGPMS